MLHVSQKCYYALRAVLELAQRRGERSTMTIAEIAGAQDIPPKFLAVILAQLKQAGFVASVRGMQGGYRLDVAPERLTVLQVIAAIDGPPESAPGARRGQATTSAGGGALLELWQVATAAVQRVFGATTFQDLIERQQAHSAALAASYSI